MTEDEAHLKLSEIVIDSDNLDYIKATGEICGKLRYDLVKLFATSDVSQRSELLKDFYAYIDDKWALGMLTDKIDEVIEGYLKNLQLRGAVPYRESNKFKK